MSQKPDVRKAGRSSLIREKVENAAEPLPTEKQEIEPPRISSSLEEKMKSWEASEEEIKAATLGGIVPGASNKLSSGTSGFDIGLYIAFPLMIIGSLMFALFPFVMDKIDVTGVGPP